MKYQLEFPETINGVTLIGSGDVLLETAKLCTNLGIKLCIVVAPRHASPEFVRELEGLRCNIDIVESVNQDTSLLRKLAAYSFLCLCFGPAWIFKEQILNIYEGRIFNYNGIPLPHYQGGAHFTWQLLNHSKEGGSYIQQITSKVDRGAIAFYSRYKLSEEHSTPEDYERENFKHSVQLIQEFLEQIILHKSTSLSENQIDWNDTMYFPRLNTQINSWINWSWDCVYVKRFCDGFDSPYPGARTFLGDNIVVLKNTTCEETDIHPYCAGLIIGRKDTSNRFKIACYRGVLSADLFLNSTQGELPLLKARLGQRLITPYEKIRSSMQSIRYSSQGLIDHDPNK